MAVRSPAARRQVIAVSVLSLAGSGCGSDDVCPKDHFRDREAACRAPVQQVATGAHHSCTLHADGKVWCWGLGEALDGSGGHVVKPQLMSGVEDAHSLAAGAYVTCAIVGSQSNVRCWGNQQQWVTLADGSPLSGASAIAVGDGFACATTDAGGFCWGSNAGGQLARPLELASSSVALANVVGPQGALGAGTAVLSWSERGELCGWGDNGSQLIAPAGDVFSLTEPVCTELLEVRQLAVGSVHACVRQADGEVICWGEQYYGQLGAASGPDERADVAPFGHAAAFAAPALDLAAGASHTCALLADGSVACCGLNESGQTGTSRNAPSDEQIRTPTTVRGLSPGVVRLGAGSSAQHTCAIVDGGKAVEYWGKNHAGQLGNGVSSLDEARFSAAPLRVAF